MAAKHKQRYIDSMANYTPPDDSSTDDDNSSSDIDTTAKKRKIAAKKEKKKDSNAPKKPLSSYMYFNIDQRSILKAKNPSLSFGELVSLAVKTYNALSEEELVKYKKLASEDKDRYLTAMETYTLPDSDSSEEKRVVKKKKMVSVKTKIAKKLIPIKESDADDDSSDSSSDVSLDDSSDDNSDTSSSGSG